MGEKSPSYEKWPLIRNYFFHPSSCKCMSWIFISNRIILLREYYCLFLSWIHNGFPIKSYKLCTMLWSYVTVGRGGYSWFKIPDLCAPSLMSHHGVSLQIHVTPDIPLQYCLAAFPGTNNSSRTLSFQLTLIFLRCWGGGRTGLCLSGAFLSQRG